MPKFYPLQQSFNGGEMSPRLYGQANTERYRVSVETMTNFIALPQGPAMRRQGFAYVDNALNDTDVRLLPFKVPGSTDYVVELGPGYMGLLSRQNGREQFTTDSFVSNGDFKQGLLSWADSTTISGSYITTTSDLKRANFQVPKSNITGSTLLKQTISTLGVATLNLKFNFGVSYTVRTAIGGNTGLETVVANNYQLLVKVGTADGLSDLYLGTFDGLSGADFYTTDTVNREFFGEPIAWDFRIGFDAIDVDIAIAAADPVYLEVEFIGGNNDDTPFTPFTNSRLGGFVGDIRLSSDAVVSDTFATPWLTESDLALVQYVSESGGGRMYFTHPSYAPQLLELENGSWSFGPAVFTAAPIEWTGTNWPSVVEFYQGRLWLGATPAQSSTIWGSKSGDPFDFTTGINDDDALELPLSTTGGIKWIKGQKGLVVGTDIGEQVITSQGSLITPTDRKADKQSGWGSVNIQPSLAGNDIVYISQDRTKVRAVNTYFNSASWTSVDLTWVAEHITRNRIIESIYIQNPNYQLYFLLADGTIVACTYDREHETIGWMNLVTDGQFLSTTKTDSVQGTIFWAATRRNEQIFIEAIDPDEAEWQFTDSWVKKQIDVDNLVVGLDHLDGLTVQVIVDGAIEPDQLVSGGQITTEQSGSFAVVGVGYTAEMITLPLGQGNPAGTSLGSKRRMSKINVQLYDSALPLINGVLPVDRSPATPMDTVEPNVTGDVEVRSLGREDGGRVTITQNLPKKTMVTAIFGKADEEKT